MAIHSLCNGRARVVWERRPGSRTGAGQEGYGVESRPTAASRRLDVTKQAGGAAIATPRRGRWPPAAEKEFKLLRILERPGLYAARADLALGRAGIAVAGLLYALALVGQVYGADEGTEKMREVGAAIRQGAKPISARQFRAIVLLVFLLTA